MASVFMTEEDSHDDSKEIMGSTMSLETVGSEDLSELTESSQAESSGQQDDYVNPRGVRFTPQEPVKEGTYLYQGIGKSRTQSLEAFWSAVERRGVGTLFMGTHCTRTYHINFNNYFKRAH